MAESWHEHYEAGKQAFEEKEYGTAIKHLMKVAEEKDYFADVFNMLGILYYNNGRYEEAARALEKAIKINPNYTEAALNLSVVYNEMGEFEKSQDAYAVAKKAEKREDEHFALDPFVKGKLANMHAAIGSVYKDLAFYSEAVDAYRKALLLRPEFVDIKINLGMVYRDMKDFSRSVRELEDAAKMNAAYHAARVQLGLTYYAMGQRDRAKAEWLKVLRFDPNDKMANMYMNLLKDEAG
ncbi:MAG: tetratricopeptide repeat protein [Thermodesulfobacteriota bacterium]